MKIKVRFRSQNEYLLIKRYLTMAVLDEDSFRLIVSYPFKYITPVDFFLVWRDFMRHKVVVKINEEYLPKGSMFKAYLDWVV